MDFSYYEMDIFVKQLNSSDLQGFSPKYSVNNLPNPLTLHKKYVQINPPNPLMFNYFCYLCGRISIS